MTDLAISLAPLIAIWIAVWRFEKRREKRALADEYRFAVARTIDHEDAPLWI